MPSDHELAMGRCVHRADHEAHEASVFFCDERHCEIITDESPVIGPQVPGSEPYEEALREAVCM